MDYVIVKWLHIVSSTLLFGTGVGSAFYMLAASLGREPRVVHWTVRHVVIADWMFTLPTVLLQPITGLYLVERAGLSLQTRWIYWSIVLYVLAGLCWVPVVWMQMRMRDMAEASSERGAALDRAYAKYLQAWIGLGAVAFCSLVLVFYLMVAKPA